MAKRAFVAAGRPTRRVVALSRFATAGAMAAFDNAGVETIACDLLADGGLERLPDAPNILFLAGMKFGSTGDLPSTWALDTLLPSLVARRFAAFERVASPPLVLNITAAQTAGSDGQPTVVGPSGGEQLPHDALDPIHPQRVLGAAGMEAVVGHERPVAGRLPRQVDDVDECDAALPGEGLEDPVVRGDGGGLPTRVTERGATGGDRVVGRPYRHDAVRRQQPEKPVENRGRIGTVPGSRDSPHHVVHADQQRQELRSEVPETRQLIIDHVGGRVAVQGEVPDHDELTRAANQPLGQLIRPAFRLSNRRADGVGIAKGNVAEDHVRMFARGPCHG